MSKKNATSTKKIKNLIIFLIILLIIILVIFGTIYFSKENIAKRNVSKINDLETDYSDYVMPLNRQELMNKYKGNLSSETIYTFLYEFETDTLPKLRKENIVSTSEYFEKNSEYIYIKTGIDDATTFNALMEKINKLSEELEFTEASIKEDGAQNVDNYTEAILEITYNETETIEITIMVEKTENSERTSVIFN